jgi:hypothetical protein
LLSQLREYTSIRWVKARGSAKHLPTHRTTITTKNHLTKSSKSAKVKKLYLRAMFSMGEGSSGQFGNLDVRAGMGRGCRQRPSPKTNHAMCKITPSKALYHILLNFEVSHASHRCLTSL